MTNRFHTARLGLAVALGLASLSLGSTVSAKTAFPNGPVIKQPTEPAPPIVYPECQRPMFIVQKGAHIFRCRLVAPTPTEGLLPLALSSDQCAPNAYWNDGPSLATTPAGVGMTAYTITCKHN